MNDLPKLVVTDIDGVWTDGSMYYDEKGNELKRFHTYDSAGVLWLRMLNIPLIICTGENSNAVKFRAKKLGIEHVMLGCKDKLSAISEWCEARGIALSDVAYIGDDINDLKIMKAVGFAACPSSASDIIKHIANEVIPMPGGSGVFRKFVEGIIGERLNDLLEAFSGDSSPQ